MSLRRHSSSGARSKTLVDEFGGNLLEAGFKFFPEVFLLYAIEGMVPFAFSVDVSEKLSSALVIAVDLRLDSFLVLMLEIA